MIDAIGPLAHLWVPTLAILANALLASPPGNWRLSGEGPGRLDARKSPSGDEAIVESGGGEVVGVEVEEGVSEEGRSVGGGEVLVYRRGKSPSHARSSFSSPGSTKYKVQSCNSQELPDTFRVNPRIRLLFFSPHFHLSSLLLFSTSTSWSSTSTSVHLLSHNSLLPFDVIGKCLPWSARWQINPPKRFGRLKRRFLF